jgi:hypothetical protein
MNGKYDWAAIIGNTLAFCILSRLHAKGILSTPELVDLLEEPLHPA